MKEKVIFVRTHTASVFFTETYNEYLKTKGHWTRDT